MQDNMKNIHILPTTQPSRLWVNNLLQGKLELSEETLIGSNTAQHIYITSDEEIKIDDYFYDKHFNNVINYGDDFTRNPNDFDDTHKIVLTTDPTLIAEGVQEIDDEFLEWFVENPSCEHVDVYKNWNYPLDKSWEYEIIIPQEEPKQELDCPYDFTSRCTMGRCDCKPKQETLEEAAYRLTAEKFEPKHIGFMLGVIEGAKWHAEQILEFLYSEITERRDYSASKMCEKVIEFIEKNKKK